MAALLGCGGRDISGDGSIAMGFAGRIAGSYARQTFTHTLVDTVRCHTKAVTGRGATREG